MEPDSTRLGQRPTFKGQLLGQLRGLGGGPGSDGLLLELAGRFAGALEFGAGGWDDRGRLGAGLRLPGLVGLGVGGGACSGPRCQSLQSGEWVWGCDGPGLVGLGIGGGAGGVRGCRHPGG